jgi:hypothetical protein
MKHILPLLLLLSVTLLGACANVSIPTGGNGPPPADAITGQPYASKSDNIKINLLGGDLDQFQAVYPNGPSVAIAGLKTSPGLGRVMDTVDSGIRWTGLTALGKGWFGQKNNEVTQAAKTARTRITTDAATSQAKTAAETSVRLKELELIPAATTPLQ